VGAYRQQLIHFNENNKTAAYEVIHRVSEILAEHLFNQPEGREVVLMSVLALFHEGIHRHVLGLEKKNRIAFVKELMKVVQESLVEEIKETARLREQRGEE
jgi:hypothetical protein